MLDSELQHLVEQVSIRYFAKPFRHQATFNGRLRTTGGRYDLQSHNIDINPKMLTDYSMDVLIGIIKHELVHYHLHLARQSPKHQAPEFKQLLRAVGGSRYAPTQVRQQSYKYLYECQQCHLQYRRKHKIDSQKFVCGRCHGKLKLISWL